MKKALYTLVIGLVMLFIAIGCEKEVFDINPTMEAYYIESVQLPSVTIDSVKSFSSKLNTFVTNHPVAKEHRRYEQIIDNINTATLKITITVNTEYDGETIIKF